MSRQIEKEKGTIFIIKTATDVSTIDAIQVKPFSVVVPVTPV